MKETRGRRVNKRWVGILFFCVWYLFAVAAPCQAKEEETYAWEDEISLYEAEELFEELQKEQGGEPIDFSLSEYVSDVLEGKTDFSVRKIFWEAAAQLGDRFESQKQVFVRILILGFLSGIFVNFAGSLGEKELSETGFFVLFLLLITTMSAGLCEVAKIASDAFSSLLAFMKVLIPSFSLALCMGSGTASSAAYYESMLIVIGFLEIAMEKLFIPGVEAYFILGMINQLSKNRFSKLAGLVKSFLRFGIRLIFGMLIGYQGIQGMLLPVMDKVKNNAFLRTAKGLPGIGSSISGVADTVMGSGMLIKSAIGIGGILCILVLCFYPLLKLFVFQLIYRIGSALIQPVSDRRVAESLHVTAECGVMLMKFVSAGALMFLLSVAIVLVGTNAVL